MLEYLRKKADGSPYNPDYSDRGMLANDLVDVLDALMCTKRMTKAQTDVMLETIMAYGYDFNPPQTDDDCRLP
jgi:hypothetical protein